MNKHQIKGTAKEVTGNVLHRHGGDRGHGGLSAERS